MNLEYKFSFQISKCWFNVTFFEVDWEDSFWNSFGFFRVAGSVTDAQHSEDRSLFYYHNSIHQIRLDVFFITIYQKRLDC